MEMEDMSLEVAERDTAAEIAAEAAVTTTSATATATPDHGDTHYRPSHHHHHHGRASSGAGAHAPSSGPAPAAAAAAAADAAHRRTCQPCRLRKVKCIAGDGPACANCERLGFTCSFAGPSPQADGGGGDGAGALSLPRRRVRLACSSCHSRKARCSGDTPKCKRCQSQGLECVYRPTKRSGGAGAGAATTPPGHAAGDSEHESAASEPPEKRRHVHDDGAPGHAQSHGVSHGQAGYGPWALSHEPITFPDEALISRTFDHFFRHVHHVPVFSFLHRASLMQRYHAGMMDKALLLALVGITSLLTDLGPGAREYGARCIDECQRIVLGDMENPSTIKIQALVFIMKYRMLTRRFTGAFMLAALASRFSYALRLNYENPNLCFLARESRRRLMWAFMTIDSGINGGYPDFTLLPAEAMHIQLPCNERNFEFDLPQATEHLRPVPTRPFADDVGSLALHVRLLWIRSRVLYCTKNVLAMPETELRELPRLVDVLAAELRAFNEHLPASFRFSDNNVKLRAYSPRLCVFIMIHVWWRQCHCDLYRVVLSGLKEALPRPALDRLPPQFVDMCQRQCFEHALATADIFRTIMSLDGGLPVTDTDLSMCAYQCARMLFFGHRTSVGQSLATSDQIHEHAQRCLRITKHMSHLPAVQVIHSDLEKLIARGVSATNTPSYPGSPDAARVPVPGQQVLSRHNPIRQMDISDMNELMPSPPVMPSPSMHVAASPSVYNALGGGGTPSCGSSAQATTPLQHRATPPIVAARAAAFADLAPAHIVSMPKPAGAAQHHPLLPPVDPPEGLDNNNAFEGAMDGFDFNFESFGNTGSEAISWFADPGGWVVSGGADYSSTTA